jgi:hypothetical protein
MHNEPDSAWLPRPLVWLKWGIAGAGILALWLALNYGTLNAYFDARARRNEVKRTVQGMEEQFQELQNDQHELEMWGFAAEKAIRERLKMARPGERVIIIEPSPAPESGITAPPQAMGEQSGTQSEE